MNEGSEPSIRSAPADMRPSALRVRLSKGAGGPRDSEPPLEVLQGRDRAMYERIAEFIKDVRTSPGIDVPDQVYWQCMEELHLFSKGRFDHVTQSFENLRALLDQLQSRLALPGNWSLDSPLDHREDRPERPASSRRPDAQTFPSVEQMQVLPHMASELNSTRRRTREVKRTSTARSPRSPHGRARCHCFPERIRCPRATSE